MIIIPGPARPQYFRTTKSMDSAEMHAEVFQHAPCAEEDVDSSLNDSTTIKKRVSFTEIHIREHHVILGDHPCCTLGLPVTLDWIIEREVSIDMEMYEATRNRRRSRAEIRLSLDDRRALLSDISDTDLRRVHRKLHRQRPFKGRAKQLFFSSLGTEPAAIAVGCSE